MSVEREKSVATSVVRLFKVSLKFILLTEIRITPTTVRVVAIQPEIVRLSEKKIVPIMAVIMTSVFVKFVPTAKFLKVNR